jgi:hypothetical protein
MRIYTATSWKNERLVLELADLLRVWGHEVYCFAERGARQHVFMWPDVVGPEDDGITCLDNEYSRQAYEVDKKGLDWSDCVILLNPCGRDAHLEAGYAKKGGGKLLIILGNWPKGEYSNMYHLAGRLIRFNKDGLKCLRLDLEEADALRAKSTR